MQEIAATIRCRCGRIFRGNVVFCMWNRVSMSRDFCDVSRRSFSWSSSLTSAVSAASTWGSSCLVNIGRSSGTYTDGASRSARVAPCSSGKVRSLPEVIEHVAFRIRPAAESVRVCVTHALFRGRLTLSCRRLGKWKIHALSMPQQGRCILVEHQAPPAGSVFSCSLKV